MHSLREKYMTTLSGVIGRLHFSTRAFIEMGYRVSTYQETVYIFIFLFEMYIDYIFISYCIT